MSKVPRGTRAVLWDKQDGSCFYCGAQCEWETFTVDHFMPRSRGGKAIERNLFGACMQCNQDKADKHPDSWAAEIRLFVRRPELMRVWPTLVKLHPANKKQLRRIVKGKQPRRDTKAMDDALMPLCVRDLLKAIGGHASDEVIAARVLDVRQYYHAMAGEFLKRVRAGESSPATSSGARH